MIEHFVAGQIEVDQSYFGSACKDKHGRGVSGKIPVFWLFKRGGKVYTKIILNVYYETLMSVMASKILSGSIVYSDSWRGYNVLAVSDFKHYKINHFEALLMLKLYQWDRKFLEPSQAPFAQI